MWKRMRALAVAGIKLFMVTAIKALAKKLALMIAEFIKNFF